MLCHHKTVPSLIPLWGRWDICSPGLLLATRPTFFTKEFSCSDIVSSSFRITTKLGGWAMDNDENHRLIFPVRWSAWLSVVYSKDYFSKVKSNRYSKKVPMNSVRISPILKLQGYSCRGIVIESYYLPTRGDYLQIGRWKGWGKYHDKKIHTTHQDYDNWSQMYHPPDDQRCIFL